MSKPDRPLDDGRIAAHRHPAVVRATHWINAFALLLLLFSGLQIFNAHPALYLGQASTFDRPLLLMGSVETPNGLRGATMLFGRTFDTTGVFGASQGGSEGLIDRGFPAWLTFPPGRDLATARRWHFFFAWVLAFNGAVYLAYGLAGRFRRELVPSRAELKGIGRSIAEHARLRFPKGEAARRYNVLQKLSYLVVIFGLIPLMVLTGMTMSPGLDAALPGLLHLFGGRQTARTIHFVTAWSLVLFALVHLAMVVAAGPVNELRSMITGRFVIDPRGDAEAKEDRP
jgi:thiosulfate reductase cytochrome b subunit